MKPVLACLGVLVWANGVLAFPPSDEVLYKRIYITRSYDVAALAGPPGGRTVEDVVSMLHAIILDRKARPGEHVFVMREGGRLDIRATVIEHVQIRHVLKDIGAKPDLAIDLKAELIEFDAAGFEKHAKGRFALADGKTPRAAVVVDERVADAVVKAGKVVQESSGRHEPKATIVASARQTMSFQPTEGRRDRGAPVSEVVKVGYRLTSALSVSADRRFIRMKLTEESRETEERVFLKPGGFGDAEEVRLPFLREVEFGKSASVEVPDADAVLFRLDYAPKDKVWVVVLRPVIFIQAEHDERNRK